jgi:hypothetical protein
MLGGPARINAKPRLVPRWVGPLHGGLSPATSGQTFVAGRVYLMLTEVIVDCYVEQIIYVVGSTAAGNVTVGIYGPVVTEDDCTAAPVLVQSASTAQGTVSTPQVITVTKTLVLAGRYYLALEGSDATGTFMRVSTQAQVANWGQQYNRGGGYGALTDPCPAAADATSGFPGIRIRCTQS